LMADTVDPSLRFKFPAGSPAVRVELIGLCR
jgi:hypothetical protein